MRAKLDAQLVRETNQILKSAEVVFGPKHRCSRNNLRYRVEVHADQERKGRSISMSRLELSVLKYRAEAAQMTVSEFVRAVTGINPPTSAHCACGYMAEEIDGGEAPSVDEIWAVAERRQPLVRDEGYGFDEDGAPLLLPGGGNPRRADLDYEDGKGITAPVLGSGEGNTGWMPPSAEDEDREYEDLVRRGLLDPDEDDEEDDDDDGGYDGGNGWMPPSDDNDDDFDDDDDDG